MFTQEHCSSEECNSHLKKTLKQTDVPACLIHLKHTLTIERHLGLLLGLGL